MNVPPYHTECHELCSLKEGTKWGKKASDCLASGMSYRKTTALALLDGVKLNNGVLGRHRKHIVVSGRSAEEVSAGIPAAPVNASNIQILESIIQKGFQNQKNWKPTISDTMKAMDMWFRLTAGNPFDELLDSLAGAALGDGGVEAPQAIGTAAETEAVEDDVDDEPS